MTPEQIAWGLRAHLARVCVECPYVEKTQSNCFKTLLEDALDLIDKTRARLISKEALGGYDKPVYVEYANGKRGCEWALLWRVDESKDIVYLTTNGTFPPSLQTFPFSEYGKRWRAWTAKPGGNLRVIVSWEV